jgi:hypothetical protein
MDTSEPSRKITDSAVQEYMQAYPIFSDRLSKDAFLARIERINWEDGRFLRACALLQLSQKCVQCERTLALSLLCSSIEAMTPKDSQVDFYSWLVKNRLGFLSMQGEKELKQDLLSAHEQWSKLPERGGAFHTFRQFLLNNCPVNVRNPPIEDSNRCCMPFADALKNIYAVFRSLFVHEGLSNASYVDSDKIVSISHILLVGKHLYFVDLKALVPWFSMVVKESLWNYIQ